MSRFVKLSKLATKASSKLLFLMLLCFLIPFLVLLGFGIIFIYQNDMMLHLIGLMLALTALSGVIHGLLGLARKAPKETKTADKVDMLQRSDWTNIDWTAWSSISVDIDHHMSQDPDWENLKALSIDILSKVSKFYRPKQSESEFAFTLPEILLVIEKVSFKYRKFVLENVPLSENINFSTAKKAYILKNKAEKFMPLYDLYRAIRLFTPVGIISELRGNIISHVFDDVNNSVQNKLKRKLLEEVAEVAVDLYSGRFKVSDSTLQPSLEALKDTRREAVPMDPLRVLLIGQQSSGKSSLVNALVDDLVAEVSAIPATDKLTIHRCEVEDTDILHLVDTPGIDGGESICQLLVEQMTHSDLILWVLKANQPGRQIDTELMNRFYAFYQSPENLHRKKPTVLMLLNQVDRLQPSNEWSPPYKLTDTTSAKAQTIKAALDYNHILFPHEEILPVCSSTDRGQYNIDVVKTTINKLCEAGINTQLNRRRIEQRGKGVKLKADLTRLSKLSGQLFKLVLASD